jgi:hypothetical protein
MERTSYVKKKGSFVRMQPEPTAFAREGPEQENDNRVG